MEDSSKCEDGESSNMISASSQVNPTPSDTKSLIDNKNTQARVVRGTKKLKLDNSDPVNIEKKGASIHYVYLQQSSQLHIYRIIIIHELFFL